MMRHGRARQFIMWAGRTLVSGLGIALVLLVFLIVLTRGAILWAIL